jgi:iron complex outermembrane receptor protein
MKISSSYRAGHLLPVLLAATALTSALPALAQDGRSQPALEEIVVTAERREQNLQDTPISATVLSAETISKRGVNSIADLQQVAPSISISQVNRTTFVNIRGVGLAQSGPTSSPGVAYYIDGQLIPHEHFIGQSFFDIGTIEVLRGPQGTLTGQNSTGGAIYVRTPEPKFNETSGYVDQTIGNYANYRTVGALNLSSGDQVALRVAGIRDVRDSFTQNIGSSSSTPGDNQLYAGRVNLALRSADQSLRVNLRGEYFDSDNDNQVVKNRTDAVSSDPYVIEEDAQSFLHQRGYRLSGEARYAISDAVELRGLTSWQDGRGTDQADGDRTTTAPPRPPASNIGRVGFSDIHFKTLVNEVNLLSTGSGPFQWVVGGFDLDETIDLSVLGDRLNTIDFVSPTSSTIAKTGNRSLSLFGQANWYVTDKIELLAGARNSWDRQRFNRLASPAGLGVSVAESSEWTGKVGVNFHLTPDTLLYVSTSKGYKAGGANLPVAAAPYTPETNVVFEGGLKTTILDERLRLNGSVFYSDYKDIQFGTLVSGLPLTQNAASAHSYGSDLEITGQFGALGLNAGIGYLKAEFASDVTLQNTFTNLSELVTKGSVLPYSPEWTINAGVQYEIDIGERQLTPRLQWAQVSTSYVTPFPSSLSTVPTRNIVDARLTFDASANLRLEAFASNLLDKTYIVNQLASTSTLNGGLVYGAPRQFGGRFAYKF